MMKDNREAEQDKYSSASCRIMITILRIREPSFFTLNSITLSRCMRKIY
jgi:hypothetical protein